MSETKHTPGPWTPDFGEAYRIKDRHGATLANVTFVNLQGRRDEIEVAANARLIAAAPDMLAAMNCAPAPADYANADAFRAAFDAWWDQTVAPAIACAEGRAP